MAPPPSSSTAPTTTSSLSPEGQLPSAPQGRPEADFQAACLKSFRKYATRCQKFQDSVQRGIPDVLAGWRGGGIWIEMKWVHEWPKRPGTKPPIHFRPGQVPWLENWWGMPLPTCVLVGSPDGWCVLKGQGLSEQIERPWSELTIRPGIPAVQDLLLALKY